MYQVEVKADSLNPYTGQRLTTIVATYPRFVHSEFMTHRVFSRNAASSRAIPVATMIKRIQADPVIPVYWGKNQKGMQAGEELTAEQIIAAEGIWLNALRLMIDSANDLGEGGVGVHKQITNRMLEPWAWMTTIITGTNWFNFERLRCDEQAQPEIQKLAYMIRDAMVVSVPVEREVHIPFGDNVPDGTSLKDTVQVATGRIARVSYLTQAGIRDIREDIRLHGDLLTQVHMSPFEHCAFAMPELDECGNFWDWCQYRHLVDWEDNWARTKHRPLGATYLAA